MKIGKIVVVTIFSFLVLFVGYLTIRYLSWKNEFFNDKENITCTTDEDYAEEEISIVDRVKNFVLSRDKTEFMTFSRRELLFALKDSLKVGDSLRIEDMCLTSERGMWRVYAHPKIGFFQLPWLGVDIVKDNRETVEVYSRNMYMGDMKIPTSLTKKVLGDINKGISDAIILVIENNFLGKTIQNIDLLDNSIVIKGIR